MLTFVIFPIVIIPSPPPSSHRSDDDLSWHGALGEPLVSYLSAPLAEEKQPTHTRIINKLRLIADLHLKLRSLIPPEQQQIQKPHGELKLQVKISR